MLIMSNQCLLTLPSQQLRSFQMIFQWKSYLINAAAGWYWHSNQHQTEEQMLSVLTWYMLNQNLSWDNYTYINTNTSYTRSIEPTAQVKSNLISFQKSPVPLESMSKADAERIYHFLITSVLLSQGEGWDLFIYALIHSALSDSRATDGLFSTLLAVRQKYCNNLCPSSATTACPSLHPVIPESTSYEWPFSLSYSALKEAVKHG